MKLEPANIVCPACGSGNYMRHLIGENVGYMDMVCINCNSYFNFDELYKRRIREVLKPKPITNSDKLRAMSDEELAAFIDEFWSSPWCPDEPPINTDTLECLMHDGDCKLCILDWLRQEVSDAL